MTSRDTRNTCGSFFQTAWNRAFSSPKDLRTSQEEHNRKYLTCRGVGWLVTLCLHPGSTKQEMWDGYKTPTRAQRCTSYNKVPPPEGSTAILIVTLTENHKSMGDISHPDIIACVRVSHATSLMNPVDSLKAPLSSTQFAQQCIKDAVKI